MDKKQATIADKATIADVPAVKPAKETRPSKGRGGTNNFGTSNKQALQNSPGVAAKAMTEALRAYRQPKVHSDEELIERLDGYFTYCAENDVVPTVEEMAAYTGYAIQTVWDWENGKSRGFSPQTSEIIKKAKDILKIFDAKMVLAGKIPFLAYCFRSKNYYGMKDQQEIVVAPQNPLGDEATTEEIAKRIAEDTSDYIDVDVED